MIAVDTNVLVYAHREDSSWHRAAYATVQSLAQGQSRWAIPWPCLHEFFAVVTHRQIYSPPTPIARAIEQIEAWLGSPSLVILSESGAHWEILRPLLRGGRLVGPLVHDARVAAICLANGVHELWTADRDFSHFPALRTTNPLIA